MNPELYERYLAKKAKKLGISVDELKAQGTSSPVSENSASSSQEVSSVGYSEPVQEEPKYVQRTIQEQLETEQNSVPVQQPFRGMQPETVKTEIPSYVFGPSKIS